MSKLTVSADTIDKITARRDSQRHRVDPFSSGLYMAYNDVLELIARDNGTADTPKCQHAFSMGACVDCGDIDNNAERVFLDSLDRT